MYPPDLGNDLPSAHLVDQASADWQHIDQPARAILGDLIRIVRAEILRQFVRAELQQGPVENRGDGTWTRNSRPPGTFRKLPTKPFICGTVPCPSPLR
jgi:hypothetical protein